MRSRPPTRQGWESRCTTRLRGRLSSASRARTGAPAPGGGSRLWHMRMLGLPHHRPGRWLPTAGPWYGCVSALCTSRAALRQSPPPPGPPMQVCIKRGDRYRPIDAAQLELDDHRVTLTPFGGGGGLVLTTPMVTRANYDKTRVALVLVPSASKAQMLRDAEWKG